MTTRTVIKNLGPDRMLIRFYGSDRMFKEEQVFLGIGESHECDIWDGHIPVQWPVPHEAASHLAEDGFKVFSSPPATGG